MAKRKKVSVAKSPELTTSEAFRRAAQLGYKRGRAHAGAVGGRGFWGSYFPGAETGRVRSDWSTTAASSTSLLRATFKILAARSEHEYRTDPYARRAIDILKTFVVGSGLRPFPSVRYANGEAIEGLNAKLAADWDRFNDQGYRNGSQLTTCYEAQGIEFVTMAVLGSWLRQIVKSKPGSYLPYAVTVLKPTKLDFSHDNYYDGLALADESTGLTILGQKMNSYAEPEGFWLENESALRSAANMSIHYRQIEAEQYLGLPWLTPSLANIWDIQQLFSDKLVQSRILTRMGVWEKKSAKGAMGALLETDADETESVPFDRQQIYYADEKPQPIQFDDSLSDSFAPLVKMSLHAIAVGAGFSYGRLTTDLEGANFAGGRINLITDSKIFNGFYKQFYKCSCQSLWNKFVEWEFFANRIPGATYNQYLADPWYYSQCYWLPEAEQWVDPLKDAEAQNVLYKTGQTTLQQLCAAQGKNYKSVIAQRKKEKEELTAAGLTELLPAAEDVGRKTVKTEQEADDENLV